MARATRQFHLRLTFCQGPTCLKMQDIVLRGDGDNLNSVDTFTGVTTCPRRSPLLATFHSNTPNIHSLFHLRKIISKRLKLKSSEERETWTPSLPLWRRTLCQLSHFPKLHRGIKFNLNIKDRQPKYKFDTQQNKKEKNECSLSFEHLKVIFVLCCHL